MAERVTSDTPRPGSDVGTDPVTRRVTGVTWKVAIVLFLVVLIGGIIAAGFMWWSTDSDRDDLRSRPGETVGP